MWAQSAREIGSIVAATRRQRGLTQVQLAKAVGATQNWISEIEQGKDTAQIGKILRVLSFLGVRLQVGEAPWQGAADTKPVRSPKAPVLADIIAAHSGPIPHRRKPKR